MVKKLTLKQEKYCAKFVECGNASEAYRYAYNAEKMKPRTVNKRALELQNNGYITGRVEALRAEHAKRHEITIDSIATELEEARVLARITQAPASMVSASMGKAKLFGLITDKQETTGKDGAPLVPNEITVKFVSAKVEPRCFN